MLFTLFLGPRARGCAPHVSLVMIHDLKSAFLLAAGASKGATRLDSRTYKVEASPSAIWMTAGLARVIANRWLA